MFHLFLLLVPGIDMLERAYARCHSVVYVLVNETDQNFFFFKFLAQKPSPTVELLLAGLKSLPLANPGEQTQRTGRPHLFCHLRLALMIERTYSV